MFSVSRLVGVSDVPILLNGSRSLGGASLLYRDPRSSCTTRTRLLANTTVQNRLRTTAGRKEWAFPLTHSEFNENIDRMVKVLAPAFVDHPVYTWFLSDYPVSEHENMLHVLFRAFLTQAFLNKGISIEAGNFGACGLLMPPGSRLQNPRTLLQAGLLPAIWTLGLRTLKRVLIDFNARIEPIHRTALSKEEQRSHWYGAFMGTTAEYREQGLATSVFFHMLEQSRSDGSPICFEAATERTRDMYLMHGGKVMGECIVGRGKVGVDGMPKKRGEGFVIWPMVWRP